MFIIDVYTKKIVGYTISNHMRAEANIAALKMALKTNKAPAIHHSDKGSQYGSNEYISLLKDNKCKISMCQTAQENAYAERINRTIKEEYLDYWHPKTLKDLKKILVKAVDHYNEKRPHNHLERLPPVIFEQKWTNNTLITKPEISIFNDNNDLESKPKQ